LFFKTKKEENVKHLFSLENVQAGVIKSVFNRDARYEKETKRERRENVSLV